jgi:hypothetical protein
LKARAVSARAFFWYNNGTMKIRLNKEYAMRHLFVAILMLALGIWFAHDGYFKYSKMDAKELYVQIEGTPPPETFSAEKLDSFKKQKTATQRGLALVCLVASLVIGTRLLSSARFKLEYDENGFVVSEKKKFSYSDIVGVEDSQWEKKNIARLNLKSAQGEMMLQLDGWHHKGVAEFLNVVKEKCSLGHKTQESDI